MRVIRGSYRGAAEWRAQRRAVREARAAGTGTGAGVPDLEPAVVVSGPGEHAEGEGVLVEAVGPDGTALWRRLIPRLGPAAGREEEDAIEAAIQEAWRRLVRHVGPPADPTDPSAAGTDA